MLTSNLSERAQHLLKVLVNRYIREGQPVGSRTLSRDVHLDLSPATIRNVMADLEEMGLVRSPHTSSGRIPTVRGYRIFIDTLLQLKPLDIQEEQRLRSQFQLPSAAESQLFEQTSHLLSEVTHLASMVMWSRRQTNALRHLEFLSLSENRVLVIMVINDHEVQNRIIHTTRPYSSAQLEQAANYLNAAFVGKDINTVREDLLRDLREARKIMDEVMHSTIEEVANKVFDHAELAQPALVMSGQTNLMELEDLSSLEKLRDLFLAFNQKYDILQLLDKSLNAQGVKIFIGEESGYQVFEECSLVTAPYHAKDGALIGVLGVIGSTRMAYEKVIPIVDLTAKLLGSALSNH